MTVPMIVYKEFVARSLPGYEWAHGSTIAERENGELICAWFSSELYGSRSQVILYARKLPDGVEWQDVRPVAGIDDPRSYGNAALFVEPRVQGGDAGQGTRRVWLFFVRNERVGERIEGRARGLDCVTYYCWSDDGGWTWSDARILRDQESFLIKNKPLRLSTGRLAVPAYSDKDNNSVLCLYDEERDAWRYSAPVPTPDDGPLVIQPAMVEWPDGELQMYFRTDSGRVWRSRSWDGGLNWDTAEPTPLLNPGSGLDAVVLSDGRLALVHNPTERGQGRTPLVLRVSIDRGTTWDREVTLQQGEREHSYPAVIQGSDGIIHVTFSYLRKWICHVQLDADQL